MSEEVTLDALFRARRRTELPDKTNVYVRALSDAERKQRELDAISASIRFDRKLKDKDSSEYLCYIHPVEEADREILVDVLCDWERNDATRTSYKEVKDEFIPYPDNASFEEKKEVEINRAESEAATKEKRSKFVEDAVTKAREKFEKLDDDVLRKEAIGKKVRYLSMMESVNEEIRRGVFYGTVKEDGARYFEDYEQVCQLDSQLLGFLYQQQLEVDSLDIWAVTKIRPGREPERVVEPNKKPEPSPELDSVVVGVRGRPSQKGRQHKRDVKPASR
jgi:hypothetical protein